MRSKRRIDQARRISAENQFSKRVLFKIKKLLGSASLMPTGAKRFVRIQPRCIIRGRPKVVSIRFGLARQTLRNLAKLGKIGGLSRYSW